MRQQILSFHNQNIRLAQTIHSIGGKHGCQHRIRNFIFLGVKIPNRCCRQSNDSFVVTKYFGFDGWNIFDASVI